MTVTSPAPTPGGGPAVLLVDDRPENLLALEAILEPIAAESGARLLRAESAEEALRHVLQEDGGIAVVLLDVVMPGTDGLETARLIRARRATEHVPIIFITALDADRRRVTLGYQFGAVDYLTKPLDPEVLRAKVRAFLEIHRRRGEQVLHERRRYADEVQALREAALRDETALVATIQRIGSALASELELERVVQLVTDEATALTGARFGAFFYNVVDPARGGDAYTLYALAGVPREHFAGFPHPRSTPVFGPTFRGEGVVRSDDITRDPRYGQLAPHHGMPEGHLPVRSYLAVPVRSRTGEILGGLFFGHERTGVFTPREERLVLGVAGWAAVAVDNARLYAAERHARTAAESAARTKSEFLATMSHEFRTPLNAILGYAQLLGMGVLGPATPAQHAHLERLQASARHLLGLIDDVLDVAKVDAERLRVRSEALLTGAVVAAAVAVVQPQATMKGVRLLDLGAGDPGVPYLGDEHRVRQVLVNLLANAVKFTPPGGEVTVTCGGAAEPDPGTRTAGAAPSPSGAWTFVRITDTGPGIAPELLARLFEPFVQGDGALTREHGGTGLGLAISRRLARLMGGDVTLRSQPGTGATFTLWLPDASAPGERAPGERAPGGAADDPRRPPDASPTSTPARGMGAILRAFDAGPLEATAYAVLHALGVRLAAEAETVAERYVAALQADGRFPGARDLPTVQLRNHATPTVGLLASQLMIIGETHGQAPELLGDGAQVQRLMAELHGAQRHRLGWSEADVEREGPMLEAEIERVLLGALASDAPDDTRAALRYATAVARHIVEQGTATSLRAYRFAKATAGP
ncbi:ATP-binding protein [Roseisolibacter sp. H3M3-2]|uniref:ATP-binding protein n=1 Tax=Roseisolibacter sp. H3M3-2 TaxID=3031323 RepID=UPI0023DA0211|nr:ATP-binding protein [Roseisolibacter sp. H3M3-2]MDF1502133.1 ATP-binding protein [Roseisolibacter sp. H3M3-2]